MTWMTESLQGHLRVFWFGIKESDKLPNSDGATTGTCSDLRFCPKKATGNRCARSARLSRIVAIVKQWVSKIKKVHAGFCV